VWEAWQDNFNFCDPISIFYLSIQSFNALQKKKMPERVHCHTKATEFLARKTNPKQA
jgi:hypothetical protein